MDYINNRADNTRENNPRQKNITFCKDQTEIENQVRAWAMAKGKEIRKPINYNDRWQDYAGKKFSVRIQAKQDGSIIIKDFDSGESHFFCLENYEFKEKKTYQKPETKTCLEDFKKLKPATQNHLYLTSKKISIKDLNIKQLNNSLVIPIYSPEGVMISWQTIDYQGEKLFKNKHTLGKAYNFPIGEPTYTIYICEGFATGVSIHTITGHRVYCSFGKSNLESLTEHILNKYPKKQVTLALDNDGPKTKEITIKNKRLITLCPETEGDFNDHQENYFEKIKLCLGVQDKLKLYKAHGEHIIKTLSKFRGNEYNLLNNNSGLPCATSIICGETGVRKTTVAFGQSLFNNTTTGYWSDENTFKGNIEPVISATETHKKKAKPPESYNKNKTEIHWLNLSQFIKIGQTPGVETILGYLDIKVKQYDLKRIILDPAEAFLENPNSSKHVRPFIALFNQYCSWEQINVTLGLNTSKTEHKNKIDKGAGSYGYKSVSKVFQWLEPCQVGSVYRPTENSPQRYILIQLTNKLAEKPTHTIWEVYKKSKTEHCLFPAYYIEDKRSKYFNHLHCSGEKALELCQPKQHIAKRREDEILEWLSTQENQEAKTRDIKNYWAGRFKVTEGKVGKILSEMCTKNKIEKTGKKSKKGDSGYKILPNLEIKKGGK